MDKEYTISYKTYFNERLKPMPFHGQKTHPLYIQVIFDRKPIYFKSYFFELLSKVKYSSRLENPNVEDIVQKEEKLLEFLSALQKEGFSLAQFKSDYQYYCRDLLDTMDEGFKDYIMTFFFDEGKPELSLLVESSKDLIPSDGLIDAFRGSLKPALYDKLVENAAYYAPPYLPLYEFAKKRIKETFVTYSVFQWQDPILKYEFVDFLKGSHLDYTITDVGKYCQQLIEIS